MSGASQDLRLPFQSQSAERNNFRATTLHQHVAPINVKKKRQDRQTDTIPLNVRFLLAVASIRKQSWMADIAPVYHFTLCIC